MTVTDETARLKRCRERFQAAQAANVTMEEQRRREQRDRRADAERLRLQAAADAQEAGRPLAWWHR